MKEKNSSTKNGDEWGFLVVFGLLAERLSSFANAYQEAVGRRVCSAQVQIFFLGGGGGGGGLACYTHRKGCGLIDILKHFAGDTDSNIYGLVV